MFKVQRMVGRDHFFPLVVLQGEGVMTLLYLYWFSHVYGPNSPLADCILNLKELCAVCVSKPLDKGSLQNPIKSAANLHAA